MRPHAAVRLAEPGIHDLVHETAKFQTTRNASTITRLFVKIRSRRSGRFPSLSNANHVPDAPKNPRFSGRQRIRRLVDKSECQSKDSVASSTIEIIDIEPDPFGDMSVIVSEVEEMVHFNVSWNRPNSTRHIGYMTSSPDYGNAAIGCYSDDLFDIPSRRELKKNHGSLSNNISEKKCNSSDKPSFAHDEYMSFSSPRKRELGRFKFQSWRPTFSISSSSKTR
jgi:hypothetical protein